MFKKKSPTVAYSIHHSRCQVFNTLKQSINYILSLIPSPVAYLLCLALKGVDAPKPQCPKPFTLIFFSFSEGTLIRCQSMRRSSETVIECQQV